MAERFRKCRFYFHSKVKKDIFSMRGGWEFIYIHGRFFSGITIMC